MAIGQPGHVICSCVRLGLPRRGCLSAGNTGCRHGSRDNKRDGTRPRQFGVLFHGVAPSKNVTEAHFIIGWAVVNRQVRVRGERVPPSPRLSPLATNRGEVRKSTAKEEVVPTREKSGRHGDFLEFPAEAAPFRYTSCLGCTIYSKS
jgi:hypothetical protein